MKKLKKSCLLAALIFLSVIVAPLVSSQNKLLARKVSLVPRVAEGNETLSICFLWIRSAHPSITTIYINGTGYTLSFGAYYTQNVTLNITINVDPNETIFVYDDHGFEFNGSNFLYTVPPYENATLTIVKLDDWGPGYWEHEERVLDMGFGTVQSYHELYLEAYDVRVFGDLLIVFTYFQETGLEFLNTTSNPMQEVVVYGNPKYGYSHLASFLVPFDEPRDIDIKDGLLICVRCYGEDSTPFDIYNITDIRNPQRISYLNFSDDQHKGSSVLVHENYTFVSGPWGFYVVNISDPQNPTVISDYIGVTDWKGDKMVYKDNVLYLVSSDHVYILNVTDPSNISLISDVFSPRKIYDVCIAEEYMFVACGAGGIDVYSIKNLTDIRYIEAIDAKNAREVEYVDDYLFVADGQFGFKVFNISNISDPQLIKFIPVSDFATSVEVSGDIVYLSLRLEGIWAFNISNMSNIYLCNSFNYSDYFVEYGYSEKCRLWFQYIKQPSYMRLHLMFKGGSYWNKTLKIYSVFYRLPIILYNDTNGDGVYTQIIEFDENESEYHVIDEPDVIYLEANYDYKPIFKDYETKLIKIEDNYWAHVAFSLENITLTPPSDSFYEGSGKANVTYHFYLLWNTTSEVYIKLEQEVTIYDLSGTFPRNNLSMFAGFAGLFGYASRGSIRPIPINVSELAEGRITLSLLNAKVALFDMNGNYSVIRNNSVIFMNRSTASAIYPSTFNEFDLQNIQIGGNFNNISENDTVVFDPHIKVYGENNFSRFKDLDPPSISVYWSPVSSKVNDTLTIISTVRDRSPIVDVSANYTLDGISKIEKMRYISNSKYEISINLGNATTLSFRITASDYWGNTAVSPLYIIEIEHPSEEEEQEEPPSSLSPILLTGVIGLTAIIVATVAVLFRKKRARKS